MKVTSVKAFFMALTIMILIGASFGSSILTLSKEEKYVSENNSSLKDGIVNISAAKASLDNSNKLVIAEDKVVSEDLTKVDAADGVSQEELDRILEEQRKQKEEEERRTKIVFDGMTLEELSNKLERSMHSDLVGQGATYAKYAIQYGVDPYLAVAISLHETGCNGNCSSLMRTCHNVGGMKGSGGCGGGSYASFSSLDEGIRAFIENIYRNYASQGLTTASAMGSKYAASPTWAAQVNAYIQRIKAA